MVRCPRRDSLDRKVQDGGGRETERGQKYLTVCTGTSSLLCSRLFELVKAVPRLRGLDSSTKLLYLVGKVGEP